MDILFGGEGEEEGRVIFGEKKEGPQEKPFAEKSLEEGEGVSKDLAANDFWLKVGILDFSVFPSFLGPGIPAGTSLSRAAILSGRLLTTLTMICRSLLGPVF